MKTERSKRAQSANAPDEPKGWTPDELAKYIRFQLGELTSANAHHEFEHLCFYLARKRIYPNLIPSTGPVSAGGDEGSDFETYDVVDSRHTPFFAESSEHKIVFACSLEKNYKRKITRDIQTILAANPSAKEIKFFSSQGIPRKIRGDLERASLKTHGVTLQIFDGPAIAVLLTDSEVFWIAERFLSIPSEVFPRRDNDHEEWYAKILSSESHPEHLSSDQFFRIRSAVRYATTNSEKHSDLPKLISKLKAYQKSVLPRISRRAFYEEFVASLRGLESVVECQAGLSEYLGTIDELEGVAELEDAAVLVNYVIGAKFRHLVSIDFDQVIAWRQQILSRIDELLKLDISSGRRSSLMNVKGFLFLSDWIETEVANVPGEMQKNENIQRAGSKAIVIWLKMLKHVRESPMFPLEDFARRLASFASAYGSCEGYADLARKTDSLLAERAGKEKLAEQAFERAKASARDEKWVSAIDELHIAHISAFTKENALSTVLIPLFLAKIYADCQLFSAAKYYSLASSFAAVKIEDDSLRKKAYRGLLEAGAADMANGASLQVLMSLQAATLLESEFSSGGDSPAKDFEWARLLTHTFRIAYSSSFVSEQLNSFILGVYLEKLGLTQAYQEFLPEIQTSFNSIHSFSELASRALEEGIAPPFADAFDSRQLHWEQLGLRWHISWQNDFHTTAAAEGFCALLQILLADIRAIEMSILEADVDLHLSLHDKAFQIEEVSSNERVIRKIYLPKANLDPGIVFAIATTILAMVSAIPQRSFLRVIRNRMKTGILKKTNPHAPFQDLFREFYLERDFARFRHFLGDLQIKIPEYLIETHEDLRGSKGLHPEYRRDESLTAIRKRYARTTGLLRFTLPRLKAHPPFADSVTVLKQEGWKDWHILLAAGNIRLNYIIHSRLPTDASPEQHLALVNEIMGKDECESDPSPPLDKFTIEELRKALKFSQLSTLRQLGFDCWQKTPVHSSIDAFLGRFNYWVDDVEHANPFDGGTPI